jgi:hypothetical protein
LGESGDLQARSLSSSNPTSARSRKAYLSDDSPPLVPRQSARGATDSSTGRFPTAVQLNSISSADYDHGISDGRVAGMSSPIRRRDVSGRGQSAKPKIADGASSNPQHSLYAPAGQRGATNIYLLCCGLPVSRCANKRSQEIRRARLCSSLTGSPLLRPHLGATWSTVRHDCCPLVLPPLPY